MSTYMYIHVCTFIWMVYKVYLYCKYVYKMFWLFKLKKDDGEMIPIENQWRETERGEMTALTHVQCFMATCRAVPFYDWHVLSGGRLWVHARDHPY